MSRSHDRVVKNGTIEVAPVATEDFVTPRGDLLERFLAAASFTATATSPSSRARS